MSKDCQLSLTNGVSVIHYSMREKNSDYIYFQVRTVFVLLSFDKLTQRDTLYIQGKQFSYSNSEVFMTTIQPNFSLYLLTVSDVGCAQSLFSPCLCFWSSS